VEAVPFMYI